MSQRTDASKFITHLLTAQQTPRLNIILTDITLVRRLIEERLRKLYGSRPTLFSGKAPVQEAVESLSTGDLFGDAAVVWIELSDKISNKQWGEFCTQFKQLSEPARQELYVLAPASARHGIPENKNFPWNAQTLLIYEPPRAESLNILSSLAARHGGSVATAKKSEIQQWCVEAYEYYSSDLDACDLHFARMAAGNLGFSDALIAKTSLDAFDFIEAFSHGDTNLIHLRMNQLEQAGEEAAGVLAAFAYTGRQVLAFQAALSKSGNTRAAHEQVKTPFPSQARIERLAKLVTTDKWCRFFLSAAELERICRNQRNAHRWLAVELTGLLG